MPPDKELFSDLEVQRIIAAVADGFVGRKASDQDAYDFYDWCQKARVEWGILQNVLEGRLIVNRRESDGEWLFKVRDDV